MSDENGLVYMRARYYSPELKRFINADVVAGSITNAITLNRYAYANGNPVSNVDPFGLSADNRGSHTFTETVTIYWPMEGHTEDESTDLIDFVNSLPPLPEGKNVISIDALDEDDFWSHLIHRNSRSLNRNAYFVDPDSITKVYPIRWYTSAYLAVVEFFKAAEGDLKNGVKKINDAIKKIFMFTPNHAPDSNGGHAGDSGELDGRDKPDTYSRKFSGGGGGSLVFEDRIDDIMNMESIQIW